MSIASCWRSTRSNSTNGISFERFVGRSTRRHQRERVPEGRQRVAGGKRQRSPRNGHVPQRASRCDARPRYRARRAMHYRGHRFPGAARLGGRYPFRGRRAWRRLPPATLFRPSGANHRRVRYVAQNENGAGILRCTRRSSTSVLEIYDATFAAGALLV